MRLVIWVASSACAWLGSAGAAPVADLVTDMPGFSAPAKVPYNLYSGYLTVPGPVAGYDSLRIHYEFHESLGDPSKDPVVCWHQGGPGGNSLYGQYGEMGYFQVSEGPNGTLQTSTNADYSWNNVANMLYLESPAGSNDPIGFSQCIKDGEPSKVCSWDDVSQGEAYAHTLHAFFEAFPKFAGRELYLSGESYAGQYLPNIAHFIVNSNSTIAKGLNLKGMLVGNGCWGGDATHVDCNGPNSEQNDLDMFHGKDMISNDAYNKAYDECKFPKTSGIACRAALSAAFEEVGPHNVYNVYDNCPDADAWLEHSGKSVHWLRNYLRDKMSQGVSQAHFDEELKAMGGGYDWSCGGLPALSTYMSRDDVQKGLHLDKPSEVHFDYSASGPASITLYPELVKKLRILIYNGDADACVPYRGNAEWISQIESQGFIKQTKKWHPWYAEGVNYMPAGYATTFSVPDSEVDTKDFQFVTIRLAGHMVPAFQPRSAFTFFKTFIAGDEV